MHTRFFTTHRCYRLALTLIFVCATLFSFAKPTYAIETNGNDTTTDVGVWFVTYNNASMWANNFGYGFPILYRPLDQNGNYSIPDSSNVALADFYLERLAAAQVDFMLFDNTNGGFAGYYTGNSWIIDNTVIMCQRIKLWNETHSWKIKYAFAIGVYDQMISPDSVGQATEKQAQYVYDNFYNNTAYGGPSNYYQLNGKPLLVLYNFNIDTLNNWNSYTGTKTYGNSFSLRMAHAGEVGTYGWTTLSGGTQLNSEVELLTPGYNNHVGTTPLQFSRDNGNYYASSWNKVLTNPLPRIVMISAFNDYNEDTAIWTADTSNLDTAHSEKWYGTDSQLHPTMYWDMTKQNIATLRSRNAVNLYNGSTTTPVQITSSNVAAQKFTTTTSINAVDVLAPSWSNNIGNLTLKLYRWNTDYNTSVNGTPIASQDFVNFIDNANLKLSFATQPAGTFVWTLSNPVEIVGIWKWADSTDASVSYLNGVPTTGSYNSRYFSAPATNLALSATTLASSSFSSWPKENVNDGNRGTPFSSQIGVKSDHTEWIEIDLDSIKTFTTVTLVNRPDMAYGFPKDFTIQVWNGTTWLDRVARTNYAQPAAGAVVPFTWGFADTTNKIRINATSLRTDNYNDYLLQFAEIEVYNN